MTTGTVADPSTRPPRSGRARRRITASSIWATSGRVLVKGTEVKTSWPVARRDAAARDRETADGCGDGQRSAYRRFGRDDALRASVTDPADRSLLNATLDGGGPIRSRPSRSPSWHSARASKHGAASRAKPIGTSPDQHVIEFPAASLYPSRPSCSPLAELWRDEVGETAHAIYLRTFCRVLSSWVHGEKSWSLSGPPLPPLRLHADQASPDLPANARRRGSAVRGGPQGHVRPMLSHQAHGYARAVRSCPPRSLLTLASTRPARRTRSVSSWSA